MDEVLIDGVTETVDDHKQQRTGGTSDARIGCGCLDWGEASVTRTADGVTGSSSRFSLGTAKRQFRRGYRRLGLGLDQTGKRNWDL
ncbi:MAG: hypothetical protein WBW53_03525 [Terriglobales bacterium]